MKRHDPALPASLALAAVLALAGIGGAWAQDATIVNARIAVGDGPVIGHGYIVVRDGRIVMVAPGQPAQTSGTIIDATGMTAVPGFIDAHKHLNTSPLGEKEQMQDLIDNGFTTVLSALGPAQSNLALIRKIDSGQINGPHIIASGRVDLRGTPDEARAAIRQMAAQGIRFTGEIAVTPEPTATPAELAVLRAAVDEGNRDGVQVLVHAVSTPAMVAATAAGVRHMVHLPNKDFMSYDDAERIAGSGTFVLDTVSFGAPIIGVFQRDDVPRFRTGLDWPESIAGANLDAQGRATGTEAAFAMMNARRIWDASRGRGLGYGSDQNYPVRDVLEHQIKSLMVMLSVPDVLRVLTINSATFLGMQNQIGTLEPQKRADIVLVQGNPFADFNNLLRTVVVLKDGKVVVDERTGRAPSQDLGSAGTAPAGDATAGAATAGTAPASAGSSPAAADPLVGTLTASVARPDQAPVQSCQRLGSVQLAQAFVTHATDVSAGTIDRPASPAGPAAPARSPAPADTNPSAPPGVVALPAHCVVTVRLGPGRRAGTELQLWLPDADWNGNFLMVGDASSMPLAAMSRPLLRGYAVASTDTGRQGVRGRAQQRLELASRALHDGAEKSKALIAAYYGGTPRYSYWIGAMADVGAQGLAQLQKYPADFDGVVVGGAADGTPDLTAFAARGGKIIEYQPGADQGPQGQGHASAATGDQAGAGSQAGAGDQADSANQPDAADQNAVRDYERIAQRSGGLQQTRGFYRLFLMPARHGGDSYRADWITVLDEWVQRGRTPEEVLAAHLPPPDLKLPPPAGLVFEPRFGVRTVCAYPEAATLQNGSGETPVDWLCLSATEGTDVARTGTEGAGAR